MLTLHAAEISEQQTAQTTQRVNGGAETALALWGNNTSALSSEVSGKSCAKDVIFGGHTGLVTAATRGTL